MKRLIIFLLCLTPFMAISQQRWKKFRYELVYGIGATNFLGELGGADQIGTDYFKDLEISATKPALAIGMRYKISQFTAFKGMLTYGWVFGDDAKTQEIYRNNRNLHFRSPIVELSGQYEFSFMKEKVGHRYRLRGIKGSSHFELFTYGFIGGGLFWFNPRAQWKAENGGDDKWYSLRKLGTEGQGAIPTRKRYSPVQIAIPVGIGFKYALDRKLSVGLEYGLRKTFTDYIDDVSTTYVDPDLIEVFNGANGAAAKGLADPAANGPNPNWTVAGQQRGDPADMDSYMFMLIKVSYKLRTQGNRPKFGR